MIDALLALPSVCETLQKSGLPVYLYGTGDGADKILDYLHENGIRVRGVFASEGFVRDRTFRGYKVESLRDVEAREEKIACVLCFGLEGTDAFSFLKPVSDKHLLLAPALPVYGTGRLDHAMLGKRRADCERIFGWLSDELSQKLYRDVLAYHLTGDIRYLQTDADTMEVPCGYISHSKFHIDVGAYDGDTTNEYLSRNPDVANILAFEPNAQTYRKLVANTDSKRVNCFHAACGAKDGTASRGGSGRGSHLELGAGDVKVRALDSVCGYPFVGSQGMAVGSIKIDAEGEDAAVLHGAANLITACRPALCVSAYHRAEDLFDLPLLLKRLDYRSELYFRKKPYVPAWDTLFYLIPKGKTL